MELDKYEAKLEFELLECEKSDRVICEECPVLDECRELLDNAPHATLVKHTYSEFIIRFYALKNKKRRLLREKTQSNSLQAENLTKNIPEL